MKLADRILTLYFTLSSKQPKCGGGNLTVFQQL